jgi:formylglycine-generating enzyme required for sulfatase activity
MVKKHLSRPILVLTFFTLVMGGSFDAPGQKSRSAPIKIPPKSTPAAAPGLKLADPDIKQKFALIIGNSEYPGDDHLPNAVKDGRILSASLRTLGFKITEKYNLTVSEMKKAITDFSALLPPNSLGLLFYAGHGIQIGGKNFLVPLDYKTLSSESDFKNKAIDVDNAIAQISGKCVLTIVILDACRTNLDNLELPFETEEGLAAIKQTSAGVYIAYSTSPNTGATDGSESNSPYSSALARNLLLKPSRLEDVFIRTRIEVENSTGSVQIPWENSSLKTVFYFTPDSLAPASGTTPVIHLKPKLPAGIKALISSALNSPVIDRSGVRTNLINMINLSFREDAGLEMVEIKGGEFQMGTGGAEAEMVFSDAQKYEDDISREAVVAEMPRHRVRVPGFFMSKYEITQAQWQTVMGELPGIPDNFRGENLPVVNITWDQANEFCERLAQATGRNYRLPSEAQWEYGARAGKETPFGLGENINSTLVNYFGGAPFGNGKRGAFRDKILPVGQLGAPNPFGLFDMHGNVWEWCADNWNDSYDGAPTDGNSWNETDPDNEPYRVVRGGAYDSIGIDCRSAHRRKQPGVEYSAMNIGFRVVVD